MLDEQFISYQFGAFRLIPSERQLLRDDQSITLPPKAFQALAILVQNHGHAVTKEELIKNLWPDSFVEESNLNHYISLVRKALNDGANGERYIETVPKFGYRFSGDVRETNGQTEPVLIHRHTRTRVVIKEEQSESLKTVSRRQQAAGRITSTSRRVAIAIMSVIILGGIAGAYFGFIRPAHSRAAKSPTNLSLSNNHESKNPAARDAYSQGRYFLNKRTTTDVRLSEQYFQKAIALDSNFALAYVGLGDAYLIDDSPKAEATLRKALELDSNLGEAHASLGFFRMFYHWDWPGAQKEFEQAVTLSPNYATAHQWYALYLASQSRLDEARREMSKAVDLEPQSANMHADLGQVLYFTRDYNDAITECHKALDLNPNFILARSYLVSIYEKKNMYAEAVEEMLTADRTAGLFSDQGISSQRESFVKTGWSGFLRARLKGRAPGHSPVDSAWFYTALGERDRALGELERAYDARDFFLTFVRVDPAYDDLRSDARFQHLLQRMNLN